MKHFAGLDLSVKETSICIEDDSGKIVRKVKVASEPTYSCKCSSERRLRGQHSLLGVERPEQLQRQGPRRGNHN